jgi:thiamine kinase-like enzyme
MRRLVSSLNADTDDAALFRKAKVVVQERFPDYEVGAISRVSGGVSNVILRVDPPPLQLDPNLQVELSRDGADKLDGDAYQSEPCSPAGSGSPCCSFSILIRIFGTAASSMVDRDRNLQNCLHLAAAGMGAHVYGYNANYQLEQWYTGHVPLDSEECMDFSVSSQIARKMADLHSAAIPFTRKGNSNCQEGEFHDHMRSLVRMAQECDSDSTSNSLGFQFQLASLSDELDSLAELGLLSLSGPAGHAEDRHGPSPEITAAARAAMSRVAFCHLDLSGCNVLRPPGSSDVKFIDFEYAAHVPVGYDIANYMLGIWEPRRVDDQQFDMSLLPSREYQLSFLRAYFDRNATSESCIFSDDFLDSCADVVFSYCVVVQLRWVCWAVVMSTVSNDFDYFGYASKRFEEYLMYKQVWLKAQQRRIPPRIVKIQ